MVKPADKTERLNGDSTEQRILAAAREEFIRCGLAGARMQAIADRAGVNKALAHYYFRTKEKLYDAVLHDTIKTIIGALHRELPKEGVNDLRTLVRQVVTIYISTLQKHPAFPRFIIRELADGGTRLPALVDAAIVSFGDIPKRTSAILMAEMERGTIRPIQPLHFMLNVVGMCVFTFIAQPILHLVNDRTCIGVKFDDAFFRERIECIVTMACDGIYKKGEGRREKGEGKT